MSAADFQKVMAHLIRFPTISLDGIHQKLGGLNLTDKEQGQLAQMENDVFVRKFGYKMRFLRQRDALQAMRLSKDFIDPVVLDHIYLNYFEPERTSGNYIHIGIEFLEFCLTDTRAQEAIGENKTFIEDILRYELTKLIIGIKDPRGFKKSLPSGSLLLHSGFKILNLRYDVPTIDKLKSTDAASCIPPTPNEIMVIFVAVDGHPYCRIFQIDKAIERFFAIQSENPDAWKEQLPDAYGAMVNLGLCRTL
jgi:hypothetical protein